MISRISFTQKKSFSSFLEPSAQPKAAPPQTKMSSPKRKSVKPAKVTPSFLHSKSTPKLIPQKNLSRNPPKVYQSSFGTPLKESTDGSALEHQTTMTKSRNIFMTNQSMTMFNTMSGSKSLGASLFQTPKPQP